MEVWLRIKMGMSDSGGEEGEMDMKRIPPFLRLL